MNRRISQAASAILALVAIAGVTVEPVHARDYATTVSAEQQQAALEDLITRFKGDEARPARLKTIRLERIGTRPNSQRTITIDRARQMRADLEFGPGQSVITPNGRFILEVVARALRSSELANTRFMIGGHTDVSGTEAANQVLSEQRALAVKAMLVEEFSIDPDRLVVVGFGERDLHDPEQPLSSDNRRIELTAIVGEHDAGGLVGSSERRREQFIDALWQSDGWLDPRKFGVEWF
jgi:outer membrane protein OmpA-like peptidoglycan-associated protein